MDNHPIPQDVTNFQFKLIGDLTLKQFGYLVTGIVLAWLIFLIPIFAIIKLPISLLVLGTGIFLAFVPFEGRPSDIMFFHFFKALFTPTQYTYQQGSSTQGHITNQPQQQDPEKKDSEKRDEMIFTSSPVPVPVIQPQQNPAKAAFVNPTQAPIAEQPPPLVAATPSVPTPPQPTPPQNVAQEEATLVEELTEAKQEEAQQQAGSQEAQLAHEKVMQLEKELHEIFLQKQELEQQVLNLQRQLSQKQQTVYTPTEAPTPEPKQTAHVIKVSQQMSKSVGIPVTSDVPNLLSGIVKDPRGNVLPNILIEVKDKDGNAVRAFKTNNLGQFASATPLVSGTYTISFEDPQGKQSFDVVEISATGDILYPIEVISVDQREKLRQELFGATAPMTA